MTIGFVLGGGGQMGAYEVGMLAALLERGIVPDLVVGNSVGALNGAAVAADPTVEAVERLRSVWLHLDEERIFGGSPFGPAANLLRRGATHLHSNRPLRALIERLLPVQRFDDLKVPFQCVAASVERAAEHWFSEGSLADAILASAALPGVLPVVEIDGEHFMDGGIVNSIPISRAVELGATEIYVLHVGRIDRPLRPPRNFVQVGAVAFEIARRHRFARDLATLPDGVRAHVLPTGEPEAPRYDSLGQLRYRAFRDVAGRIDRARIATAEYLDHR
ncbi:MAG TPA: patatin-like phospholipase family protein [Actinomycetota bacterium]|nr:patatin-like phospholipase family protein [Actinomycetota bacterium]